MCSLGSKIATKDGYLISCHIINQLEMKCKLAPSCESLKSRIKFSLSLELRLQCASSNGAQVPF